ncbi:conserved hypothetical protein, partial [delta proteobacterium NaphS2]
TEELNGKYWSYPFKKAWEIYNQDNICWMKRHWVKQICSA